MSITVNVRCTNYATAPLKAVGQKIPVVPGRGWASTNVSTSWRPSKRAGLESRLRAHRLHRNAVIGIIAVLFGFQSPTWMATVAVLWQVGVAFAVGRQAIRASEQLRECELEEALGCSDGPDGIFPDQGSLTVAQLAKLHQAMKVARAATANTAVSIGQLRALNNVLLWSETTGIPIQRLLDIRTEP